MSRVIILLSIFSSFIYSQTYYGTAAGIFFGRQPSAKTEAMGEILSLNFDPYFMSQSNPAALTSAQGVSIFYSYSSPPFYFVDNLNFYFGGVSVNTKNFGAFAVNIQCLDFGTVVQTTPTSAEPIGSYHLTEQLYTFTYANSLLNYFDYGISANFLIENFGTEHPSKGMFLEFGIIKDFKVIENAKIDDHLLLGTQIKNIFNQLIEFTFEQENGDVIREKEFFPSIFRIGISNEFEYSNKRMYKHSHLVALTIGIEFQDVLNSKYYTAYKFGAELSLFNILYLRTGYYYETANDYGIENNKDYKEDFTYGLGLNLNIENYFYARFPVSIKIDYVNLKQPTTLTDFNDWDNFTTFDIIINYRF